MWKRLILRWAWAIAALWALAILVGCFWGIMGGPFHNWTRDQKIAVSQSAVALAGFGAGAVALFSTASQLGSLLGNPRVEIQPERPITLIEPDEYPDAYAHDPVPFWIVNQGDAVVVAWHCEIRVARPLSIQLSRPSADLGAETPDPYTVTFNTTWHPLFPGAPVRLGDFRLVASRTAVNAIPGFTPRIECRVFTDKGKSTTNLHGSVQKSRTTDPPGE